MRQGRFKPALLAALAAQQRGGRGGILSSGMPGMRNATQAQVSGALPQFGQRAPQMPGVRGGMMATPRANAYQAQQAARGGMGGGMGRPMAPGVVGGQSAFGGITPVRRSAQDDEALRVAIKSFMAGR